MSAGARGTDAAKTRTAAPRSQPATHRRRPRSACSTTSSPGKRGDPARPKPRPSGSLATPMPSSVLLGVLLQILAARSHGDEAGGATMDGERREQPFPISLDGHGLGTLRVTADRRPGGVSVRLTGEMDIATAPQLVATMRSLSRRDMQHVWLDLAGLTFIDASGLAALVKARMLVDRQGGRLT